MIPTLQQTGAMVALFAVSALWPSFAGAQDAPPGDPAAARIHLGGLALNPRLNIRDVGVDTNVFNESDNPTRDVTALFGPSLDSWLRAGPVAMSGSSQLDWHYFQQTTSQRSFDASQSGRVDIDLGYFVPHVEGAIGRTRERPSLEVDVRVGQRTTRAGAGVVARLGPKFSLDLSQQRRSLAFDDVEFRDLDLADTLDRTEIATSLSVKYTVTPLTTFVVRAEDRRDRFDRSAVRDADSVAVIPGFEFKPLALISGSAAVGFRRFSPTSSDAPEFQGVVADVDLHYILRDFLKLDLGVTRDVDYSADLADPYFVASGVSGSVTQELGGGWDVVARVASTRLDYHPFVDAERDADAARRDRVDVYGIGVGRRLTNGVRVGVDVNHARRRSPVDVYDYQGLQVGGSITYGY